LLIKQRGGDGGETFLKWWGENRGDTSNWGGREELRKGKFTRGSMKVGRINMAKKGGALVLKVLLQAWSGDRSII